MSDLIPDDGTPTPLTALPTQQQRDFVSTLVSLGGGHGAATKAARAAGYASPAVAAYKLLRNQRVLAALRFEIETSVKISAVRAFKVLEELADNGPADVRLRAANSILDRAGLLVPRFSQHHVIVEDRRTDAELIDRIKEIAVKHNLDPAKLLGGMRETVVDGDFTEVASEVDFTVYPDGEEPAEDAWRSGTLGKMRRT